MKWRHSKEAQAQKDKEKEEQPDTSASESGSREPKEPLESECESDGGSESGESDEVREEGEEEREEEEGRNSDGHMDISELNKTSVIMSGSGPTVTTVTDTPTSQILIWRRVFDGLRLQEFDFF